MRVWAAVVGGISVFACALMWATSGSADQGSRMCGPKHAKTLTYDRAARVYSQGGNVYGCARAGDHSVRLGSGANSVSEGRAGPVALAGVDVAYALTYHGVDTVSAEVVVRNLTNGVVLRRRDSWSGSGAVEGIETVDDITVKSDGAVAWIATDGSVTSGSATDTEVEKSDRSSRTLLDRSTQIKAHSLHLFRSRLSWRDGSANQHAMLR